MNSDLVKLNKSGSVLDIDIQNEIIRSEQRMNNIETLLDPGSNIIETSMNELLKTIMQKLWLDMYCFFEFLYTYFCRESTSNHDMQKYVLFV